MGKDKKDSELLHVQYIGNRKPLCPCCQGELKMRDTKRRIMRKSQSEIFWLQIRRMKCLHCGYLHNELPDCVIAQKQYSFEVIKEALEKRIVNELSFADVENSTINRWYF